MNLIDSNFDYIWAALMEKVEMVVGISGGGGWWGDKWEVRAVVISVELSYYFLTPYLLYINY